MAKLKYDARASTGTNIVWDVSWDYHFDPDFVAYGENGVLDLYLNAVVGLTRKYYDVKLIHQMFEEMEDSALVDTFTDLFWLGAGILYLCQGNPCTAGAEISAGTACQSLFRWDEAGQAGRCP